ncbi:hypothetical protein L0337_43110 [candidate division KSB1 bacterium]|nr:hypothetical protein [candidate division KSB1 bacterium]
MSKRTTSLSSNSNDYNEVGCLPRQVRLFLRVAMLALILGAWIDALAQQQSNCDSLQVAWRYYLYEGAFDKALALVATCEEPNALELRAFVALKHRDKELAEELLCELLKRKPDYTPDLSKPLPVSNFIARVEELKQKCAPKESIIQPETNVLGWLEINLGGGTYLGGPYKNLQYEYDNPVLAHLRIGLNIAEIELRTIEIINTLSNGKAQLLTGAFKLGIPEGLLAPVLPGVTVIGRTSFGVLDADQLKENRKYRKEIESLVLYVSKTLGSVRLHGGLSHMILKARVLDVRDMPGDSSDSKHGKIFAALQWQVNSITMFMAGFEPVALYKVDDSQQLQEVGTRNLVAIAVRAFPLRWLAIEVGGGYWRNHPSKDRFHVKLGATVGWSLPKIFHELSKQEND